GTYPLPEAQLDRFMFQVDVDYPSESEEEEIVRQQTSDYKPELRRVLSPQRILELQDLVRRVPAADHVVKYAVALARATRPGAHAPPFLKEYVPGAARVGVPRGRRQGARDPRRALRGVARRHRRARAADAPAPPDPQLPRRGGGPARRRPRRPAARSGRALIMPALDPVSLARLG